MAFAAAVSPIAGMIGGMMQARQHEKIANWNAERIREKGSLAQAMGAQESRLREDQGKAAAARHRAVTAQGGASTSEGTPLLMQEEFAKDTFFNSEVAMFNAKSRQTDLENKASLTQYEGKIRANAARNKAVGDLLKTSAKMAKVGFG